MEQYICIDIGGTSIKYGIIAEDKAFVTTAEIPTQALECGGNGIMKKVIKIIEDYQKDYTLNGICISTAGMVDCENGIIDYASPLIPNYTGTPIKNILETKFDLHCEVENDVICAGLAEYYSGAAKNTKISVCITVGTGIGGAVIINGQPFHGISNSACEIGYMHLPNGEFQNIGASSILTKKAAEYKNLNPQNIDGKYVFEQAKSGDTDCIKAIDEMTDILGIGIANICYVLNPEIVVLGGGIMAQKDYLYTKIRKSMDNYLIPYIAQKTKLAFAQNVNQAGMLGAFYNYKSKQKI